MVFFFHLGNMFDRNTNNMLLFIQAFFLFFYTNPLSYLFSSSSLTSTSLFYNLLFLFVCFQISKAFLHSRLFPQVHQHHAAQPQQQPEQQPQQREREGNPQRLGFFENNISTFTVIALLFLLWAVIEPTMEIDILDDTHAYDEDASDLISMFYGGIPSTFSHSSAASTNQQQEQSEPGNNGGNDVQSGLNAEGIEVQFVNGEYRAVSSRRSQTQQYHHSANDSVVDIIIFLTIALAVYIIHHWPRIYRFILRSLPARFQQRWRNFITFVGLLPRNPPPGSVPAALNRIPDTILEENHFLMHGPVITCSICLENMKIGETAKKLVCNHIFHKNCVTPWLVNHNSCPTCRAELEHENFDYEPEPPIPEELRREIHQNR